MAIHNLVTSSPLFTSSTPTTKRIPHLLRRHVFGNISDIKFEHIKTTNKSGKTDKYRKNYRNTCEYNGVNKRDSIMREERTTPRLVVAAPPLKPTGPKPEVAVTSKRLDVDHTCTIQQQSPVQWLSRYCKLRQQLRTRSDKSRERLEAIRQKYVDVRNTRDILIDNLRRARKDGANTPGANSQRRKNRVAGQQKRLDGNVKRTTSTPLSSSSIGRTSLSTLSPTNIERSSISSDADKTSVLYTTNDMMTSSNTRSVNNGVTSTLPHCTKDITTSNEINDRNTVSHGKISPIRMHRQQHINDKSSPRSPSVSLPRIPSPNLAKYRIGLGIRT